MGPKTLRTVCTILQPLMSLFGYSVEGTLQPALSTIHATLPEALPFSMVKMKASLFSCSSSSAAGAAAVLIASTNTEDMDEDGQDEDGQEGHDDDPEEVGASEGLVCVVEEWESMQRLENFEAKGIESVEQRLLIGFVDMTLNSSSIKYNDQNKNNTDI